MSLIVCSLYIVFAHFTFSVIINAAFSLKMILWLHKRCPSSRELIKTFHISWFGLRYQCSIHVVIRLLRPEAQVVDFCLIPYRWKTVVLVLYSEMLVHFENVGFFPFFCLKCSMVSNDEVLVRLKIVLSRHRGHYFHPYDSGHDETNNVSKR